MWLTGTVGWLVCVGGEEGRIHRKNGSSRVVWSGTVEGTKMTVKEVPEWLDNSAHLQC